MADFDFDTDPVPQPKAVEPLPETAPVIPSNPSTDEDEVEEETFLRLLNQRSLAPDEFQEKFASATNLYDAGINIDTLRGFTRGWNIFGKQGTSIPKKDGRVIGIVGDFKSGKTWFLRRLLQVLLMDDTAIHTPGLSVKFPDAPPGADGNKPQTVANSKLLSNKKKMTKDKTLDLIVLDAAGGDVPTSEELLQDQVATEAYLRELIINISTAVVFLCSKYTRSTQITINSLINQINSLGPEKQKITPDNRIFVIHNHIEVASPADIDNPTQELLNLYDDDKLTAAMRDSTFDIAFWQTDKQTHVFLGNDNTCKEYNDRVFEILRTDLLSKYNVTPNFSLQDKVVEFTKNNLKRFVEGMENPKIEIHTEGANACLRPVVEQRGGKIRPLKLQKLKILVGGQVSENSLDLKVLATISNEDGKSYYVFKAETPGLKSANNVKYSFSGVRTLRVVVHTNDQAPTADETIVYNSRQYGELVFTWKAPKDSPFAAAKILDQKLEHGILQFRIERTRTGAIEVGGHEVK